MILGDSLNVMASLAEREGLRGKVQMIYIDPPYGIKFGSNWQVSARKRDVKDGKLEDVSREVEQIKAFRDTWELGIHSYLTYLRDRLTVAKDLLTESGSIFVQIGDENVHLVRSVMDEVFGAKTSYHSYCDNEERRQPVDEPDSDSASTTSLWYATDRAGSLNIGLCLIDATDLEAGDYTNVVLESDGDTRPMTRRGRDWQRTSLCRRVAYFALDNLTAKRRTGSRIPFECEGETFRPLNRQLLVEDDSRRDAIDLLLAIGRVRRWEERFAIVASSTTSRRAV